MNKNPTQQRLLILYFLTTLHKNMGEHTNGYSETLVSMLNHEDVKNTLHWLYKGNISKEFGNIQKMDTGEMLDAIGGESHILSFYIEYWKNKTIDVVTPIKVYDVLTQLQLETHYLMTKILADWDEYDHSNFRALCIRAGIAETLYGIFDAEVSEEDKYIVTSQAKPYRTRWEAEAKLAELVSTGRFRENELKIMSL